MLCPACRFCLIIQHLIKNPCLGLYTHQYLSSPDVSLLSSLLAEKSRFKGRILLFSTCSGGGLV